TFLGIKRNTTGDQMDEDHLREGQLEKIQQGNQGSSTSPSKHPFWDIAANLIRQSSETISIPCNPDGLSNTITEHIREFATATSNLWNGAIYKKSLDYLLRVLLRVHLAPNRELANRERSNAIARRKQDRPKTTGKMTLGLWRSKVRILCDELDKVLHSNSSSPKEKRIHAIAARLSELQVQKPEVVDARLPSLEAQLESIASTVIDESQLLQDEYLDEDALDGQDEDVLDEEDDILDVEDKVKEPSRARLRSLQAVLKTLLESPFIIKPIDVDW
ncbi:hypothetical protein BGX27_006066, partial [Mortierella sp. AM989]